MGVVLYKKNQAKVFNEHSFLHMLDAGWSYSPDEAVLKAEEHKEKEAARILAEQEAEKKEELKEQAVIIRAGKLADKIKKDNATDQEIREFAKTMKVKNWHTKSIDTLKEEIKG